MTSKNKFLESDSDDDSDEEIDIHGIAATGTIEEMKWALQKDRLKLCNLKEKVRLLLSFSLFILS